MIVSRREMFKLLAAGATVVAGEIWIPGKTILIPKRVEVYLYGLTMEDMSPGGFTEHSFVSAPQIESLTTGFTPKWRMSWYEKHPGTPQEWRHFTRLYQSWEKIEYPLSKAFSDKGMHIQQPPKETNHGA